MTSERVRRTFRMPMDLGIVPSGTARADYVCEWVRPAAVVGAIWVVEPGWWNSHDRQAASREQDAIPEYAWLLVDGECDGEDAVVNDFSPPDGSPEPKVSGKTKLVLRYDWKE